MAPAATPGPPADLRAALLQAARAELSEVGGAALSLRAVARRAGVSHAAPGYAFGDRAGLMTAVAAQGFAELAAVMDAPPALSGREGVAELGRRYVAFAQGEPALYAVMFHPADLVVGDAELVAAQAASLVALTQVTRGDGAAGPLGEVTLISWAFAHGAASLVLQGALPVEAVAGLLDSYAALVHP